MSKKSIFKRRNNRGVFGLTAVQSFFAIILGLALLAYVIVVIMGTLGSSTILPSNSLSATITGEASFINRTGDPLTNIQLDGYTVSSITAINASSGLLITSGNYTISSGIITNATSTEWNSVTLNYTYTYNSNANTQAKTILTNTSTGIAAFFGAINPVYAILAILVIILVLVVLVRVVTSSTSSSGGSTPQL